MPAEAWPIEHDPVFGCWTWRGYTDEYGYGILYTASGPTQAHRSVYRALVGDIPVGMVLDHLCRRRNCVRPAHLDPVTATENQLRRMWRQRCRRQKCPSGHDLAIHVMVTPEGGRLCRICQGP